MSGLGIVGCGYWGSKHVRVASELQEERSPIVVCDPDPKQLERIRAHYPGVKTTSEYIEVLESDVEAVILATPVSTHFPLAREALLAGKHVLVEKPLTTTTEMGQELVRLADERQLVLMTGHTYQYHPAVELLRDMLTSGELGDLYYIDSARLNLGVFQPEVDVLWDLAPHDLSILLYLLGQDPTWVSAQATAHVNPAQFEISYLELGFPGQVLAHVHVSWLDPCKVRRMTLVGSKRMVVFDDVNPAEQVRIYDKGVSINPNGNGGNGPEVLYRHGEVRIPFIGTEEPLKREVADFLDCIASGETPRSSGVEGLRVVSILESAHESLDNGGIRSPVASVQYPENPLSSRVMTAIPTAGR